MISFESSDLERLVADLQKAQTAVGPAMRGIVSRGALNIKRVGAQLFTEKRVGGYLPHYARSISYDLTSDSYGAEAVIGPESDKPQGGMGAGVEYGNPAHHTPPIPHMNPALDNEEPKFLNAVGDVAEGLLK